MENVRATVELFGADRIGQGTAAGKDPQILDPLAAQDICVEVCPISNRLTDAVRPIADSAQTSALIREAGIPQERLTALIRKLVTDPR